MRVFFGLFISLILVGCGNNVGDTVSPAKHLDSRLEELRKNFSVPGMAVAVVQDGKLIYGQGFGLRNKEKNLPVDTDTLFAIGSTTKAMTAAGLGLLVEEGKLTWDTRVKDVLTDFQLHDQEATEKATVRDLLTHQTGLPRHDIAWVGSSMSRQKFFDALKHLKFNKPYKERWEYNNFMYMVAGMVAAKASGEANWETFTQKRILDPLGMSRTNFSSHDMIKMNNIAFPYTQANNQLLVLPHANLDPIAPAGSVNSPVSDMVKWISAQMDESLLKQETLAEIQRPQAELPELFANLFGSFKGVSMNKYGLGWMIGEYDGLKFVSHDGGLPGFITNVAFVPEKNIGVVTFINLFNNVSFLVPMLTSLTALDAFIGFRDQDRVDQMSDIMTGLKSGHVNPDVNFVAAPRPLKDFQGTCEHPTYQKIVFKVVDGNLTVKHNAFEIPKLGFTDKGEWEAADFDMVYGWRPPPLTFVEDKEGNVVGVNWLLEPALKDPISFTKMSDATEGVEAQSAPTTKFF